MEWMLMPLKRYFDFQGRSQRMEYWMFVLFQTIVMIGLALIAAVFGAFDDDGQSTLGTVFLGLMVLVYLGAFFIPTLACQVRRFHDQDKSGWFILLGFIPYVGGLITLIFMCLDGTQGPNRFGPDPKKPYDENVFA